MDRMANGARSRPGTASGTPPHAATVPRGSAVRTAGPSSAAKKRVGGPLAVDVKRLERNWNGAALARPHRALTLRKRGGGDAGEPWEFECLGTPGRVNYDAGKYDVAHVAIQPGKRARWAEYWFMIDTEGGIVDAPARLFERESKAQGLSKLPPDYERPIRALLTTLYAGALG